MKRIIDSVRDKFSFQEIQLTSQLSDLKVAELEKIASDLKEKIDKITPKNLLLNTSSSRSSNISGNKNKLISKIQSLQIVLAISQIYSQEEEDGKENTEKDPKIIHVISNGLVTKIMRYALSIQTDKFDTPRYLRVI
jgi:nitrate reductase NapAB chaperone NapD